MVYNQPNFWKGRDLMNLNKYLKGKIFVLSAPSGSGKTSLVNKMLEDFPVLEQSISYTTRPPRKGEINGKDYFFIDADDFRKKIEQDFFYEWAEVYGNFYGTSKSFIDERLNDGAFIICSIDTQGALNVKRHLPHDSVLVFVLPPSMEELESRLRRRGLDDDEVVKQRLENARFEASFFHHYRYVIVNDEFDYAAGILHEILDAEINASVSKNINIIKRFL